MAKKTKGSSKSSGKAKKGVKVYSDKLLGSVRGGTLLSTLNKKHIGSIKFVV